jgi:SAM-dependent methyltransferase
LTALEKYDRIAPRYSEHDYADAAAYAHRAASLVVALGPPLAKGDSVVDLACGDGVLARPLLELGLRYAGVDASAPMVEAARRRNPGVAFEVARLEDYVPPEPVDAAICLRAFYYAPDRPAFFRHVAGYVRRKLVFDVRPAAYDVDEIVRELHAAGFSNVRLRPFFAPQKRRLPRRAGAAVAALERTGPLASLVARRYGRLLCAASAATGSDPVTNDPRAGGLGERA